MPSLNIQALLDELSIPYMSGGKHSTPGHIQLKCPYCDDNADHLGYHLQKEYFHCWKCGWHPLVETISLLGGISKWNAYKLVEQHSTGRPMKRPELETPIYPTPKAVEFPYGTRPLQTNHWKFLIEIRGFTKHYIKSLLPKYNILGTSPVGVYKLRILFPITHYSKLVSYQCRDITNKSQLRYLACAKKDEVYPHKNCLFGADHVPGKRVVVTEGILDALKLGPGAVSTFGTSVTWAQIKQLVDRWKERFIFFDSDEAGQIAAKKLAATLSVCNGKIFILSVPEVKDAGEMSLYRAQQFMKKLKIKG